MENKLYLYEVIYKTDSTNFEKYFVLMHDDGRCPVDVAKELVHQVSEWANVYANQPCEVDQILLHEVTMTAPMPGTGIASYLTKHMKTKVLYENQTILTKMLDTMFGEVDHPTDC